MRKELLWYCTAVWHASCCSVNKPFLTCKDTRSTSEQRILDSLDFLKPFFCFNYFQVLFFLKFQRNLIFFFVDSSRHSFVGFAFDKQTLPITCASRITATLLRINCGMLSNLGKCRFTVSSSRLCRLLFLGFLFGLEARKQPMHAMAICSDCPATTSRPVICSVCPAAPRTRWPSAVLVQPPWPPQPVSCSVCPATFTTRDLQCLSSRAPMHAVAIRDLQYLQCLSSRSHSP